MAKAEGEAAGGGRFDDVGPTVPELHIAVGPGAGGLLPRLDRAAADGAATGAGFVRWLRDRRQTLARGFDRLSALDGLSLRLFPHQRRAVLRVLQNMRGRALLADEVGLGKTIEAGVVAKEYIVRGLARRMLVLAPASLTEQWRRELEEKLALPCRVFAPGDAWAEHERVIASLDTARRPEHAAVLQALPWDIVIVDEAHRLKNRRTRGWRLVDGLQKKYMLLLTATPIQNDLEELYNMMTLLQPGLLRTYRTFRREYVADRRAAKRLDGLRARIGQAIVRTTRRTAGLAMPRRSVHTVSVPLNGKERRFYDGVFEFARDAFARQGGADGRGANPLPFLLLLRRLLSSPEAARATLGRMAEAEAFGPATRRRAAAWAGAAAGLIGRSSRLAAVTEWIARAREPAIVYTQFRATQEAVVEALARRELPAATFHGGMDPEARRRALGDFRRRGGVLVSTDAGSEGQNLQFCRIVVNYDLPWNPMRVEQRIGRVHRLGQSRDVVIVNVLAPDTVEMHVYRLLREKIRLFEQVIGELDVILTGADGEEPEGDDAFSRRLGAVFLHAPDDEAVRRGVEALGREAAAARARFARTARLNAALLPETSVSAEGKEPGAGPAGRSEPEGVPVTARLLHPLCLEPEFAADVLGAAKGGPWSRRLRRALGKLRFDGASSRSVVRRLVHHRRWLFCFRVSYRSDETREELHTVAVDPLTERVGFEAPPEEFVDVALAAGLCAEGGGPSREIRTEGEAGASYEMRRAYREAVQFLKEYVRCEEGREHLDASRARLARDEARLDEFYEGLKEEALLPVVQQLRRVEAARVRSRWLRFVVPDAGTGDASPTDADGLARRVEQITAGLAEDRRRRLGELAVKYSIRAEVDLIGGAWWTTPRVELTYRLLEPIRRDVVFYYDPLEDAFVDLECERCDAPLTAVAAAPDGGLLCPECLHRDES